MPRHAPVAITAILVALVLAACGSSRDPQSAATSSRSAALVACTTCHGDPANGNAAPPLSVRGANATTNRAVGAHQQHLRDGALRTAVECAECHVVPASASDPSHMSGATATLTWGPLASAGGVSPSFTVSPDGQSLTCTTYCHGASFAATSGSNHAPSWTRVDGTQAGCGTCHGIPPPAPHPTVPNGLTGCNGCHPGTVKADGSIDVTSGLHIDGAVELAGGACTTCHGDATRTPPAVAAAPPKDTLGNTTTTAAGVGAHQQHLLGGSIRDAMACTDCHTVPSDTAHATQPLNLTWSALASTGVTPTWNETTLTCTNYCHGATLPGGALTSPVWTSGSSQAVCGSCHGLPPPTSSGHPSVGSALTGCATCHGGTVNADGTINVAGGKHVNGVVDVSGASCTTCHGDATRTPAEIAAAPPKDTLGNTATTAAGVGAHQQHLLGGSIRVALACTDCHTLPSSTAHSTQPLNLTWSALASTGVTPTWNGTTLTCTNYCHGATLVGGTDTTPVWTSGSSQAACGTCHGLPPGTGHHSTHSSRNIGCGTCHGTGFSSTTVNTALHVNGVKNIASGTPPGWNATTRSCSNSCHGTEFW